MSSKIVLAYAKHDWNLGQNPRTGIGLFSKRLYESLCRVFYDHEVIYVSFKDYNLVRGLKGVDRLFTISAHMNEFQKKVRADEFNLIAVNEHALARRLIKDYRRQICAPRNLLDTHDGIYSNLKEIRGVSNVFAIGSWNVIKSFELFGFDPMKTYAAGFRYWEPVKSISKNDKRNTILIFIGYICLRKGLAFIQVILEHLAKNYPHFSVRLVGVAHNMHVSDLIRSLQFEYPNSFEWIDSHVQYGSREWIQMGNNVSFALFPSWEEGMAGCAMDVINLGIPLIYSDRTGLDSPHEFLSNLDFFEPGWIHYLDKLIVGGFKLWDEIARRQNNAAFFQKLPENSLDLPLSRLKQGKLWPNLFIESKSECDFIDDSSRNLISFNQANSEYKLEWLQEIPSSPTIRLNLQPRNNQSFSTFDRLRLLIMALDRHVNYQNAVCDSQENGESINLHLSRLKKYPDKMDDGSLDNLSIYLRNYHHLNLSPLKIRTIKIREGMVDWYNRKLILQFRLFSARLKMKINIEKGRLSQIISNRFK